ncbi:MOSC domain-containing protein [Calothrix sp. NIES-4071]|nr:MOSC domain-containing protein [Calothrix sp. NIES-4071]BAZ60633.1 MOSC domain-containing protein [Calothrix sp. NIES-4105]
MTNIFIKQLYIHPIKGLTPQAQESVFLKVGHGIPGDRAFALMYKQNIADSFHDRVPWMKKGNFAMQNDWHSLAALDCSYNEISEELTIKRKGIELLVADTSTTTGRNEISTFFTGYLAASYPSPGISKRAPLQLVGSYNKTRYQDREAGHISLVSQATINNLSEIAGKEIDVRRFRPNIILDGTSAWSEFDWVGKQIKIGKVLVEITARINRCLNIEVNPSTGERDIALLSILKNNFQHTQTGVIATIITEGQIRNEDVIEL